MKFTSTTVLAALLPSVYGHYFFDRIIVDGKETGGGEYVRTSTKQIKYNPIKFVDAPDNSTPEMDDIRCGQGAFTSAAKTKVYEVKAGTDVTFKLFYGATMQHPGPLLGYMSKAPGSVKEYRGDGPWFKIYEAGVCKENGDLTRDAWCSWDKPTVTLTIPKDTPDGEYLLRAEHIALHGAHGGHAEFYPNCAQIKVTGGGSGTPGPTFLLPGGYKKDDPSLNFNIYGGGKRSYPMPGPAVWKGGNTGGATQPVPSSSTSSQAAIVSTTLVRSTSNAPVPTTTTPAVVQTTAVTEPVSTSAPASVTTAPPAISAVKPTTTGSSGSTRPTKKPCNKGRKNRHGRPGNRPSKRA